jgi:hypothetical protein
MKNKINPKLPQISQLSIWVIFLFGFFHVHALSVTRLKDTTLFYGNPVVFLENGCSGFLFPGTDVIWTLNECLTYGPEGQSITNIITSDRITEHENRNHLQARDTFMQPEILFQFNDWALLRAKLPKAYPEKSNLFFESLIQNPDTLIMGYPTVTNYESDGISNYVDLILLPLWKYQLDTFLQRLNPPSTFNKKPIKNESLVNHSLLVEHNKEYLIEITKSDIPYLNDYTLNKAIEFCIKSWTDHQFLRNRMATLSIFEDTPSNREKMSIWMNLEDRRHETFGLAGRLFLSFLLLPVHLLPEKANEIVLSFQKDFLKSAQFLMEHPKLLNEINLFIRSIPFKPYNYQKYPKWNPREITYKGDGTFQVMKGLKNEELKHHVFWRVPGIGGAPIFSKGFLIGIHKQVPFYASREFVCDSSLLLISTKELSALREEKKLEEIWKKISGLIQE